MILRSGKFLTFLQTFLFLTGCSHRSRPHFSEADRSHPTRRFHLHLEPKQFISAEGHPIGGEAGEIIVPENRRTTSSRQISLFFRRLSYGEGKETVFHFTGGPGVSNLKHRYPEALLQEFAVVEVGYRGIDSSTVLDCPELKAVLVRTDLNTDSGTEAVKESFSSCLQNFKSQGVDIQSYQLKDVIDDAEDLRKALGLKKIHIIADSFGTRLAQLYMTNYPDSVKRTILLGANPPGFFFWSADSVGLGFKAYETYFKKAFPRQGRTLEQLITEVLAKLPARSMGLKLDGERIKIVSFILLFHQKTSSFALDSYLRAYEQGDYDGLALMSFLYDYVIPRAFDSWTDFFVKGLVTDYDPDRDYSKEATAGLDGFGSPLGKLFFGPKYPKELFAFRDPRTVIDIKTPTLILSGELDFSTPAGNSSLELVDRFPTLVSQVIVPTYGHVNDFWEEREVLTKVITSYLRNGEVPKRTTFPERPVMFRRSIGFTHVPKAAVGFVVGALISLGLFFF